MKRYRVLLPFELDVEGRTIEVQATDVVFDEAFEDADELADLLELGIVVEDDYRLEELGRPGDGHKWMA